MMIHHLKKTKNQIIVSTNKDNRKQKNTSTAKTGDEAMLFYLYGWHLYHGWVLKKEDL